MPVMSIKEMHLKKIKNSTFMRINREVFSNYRYILDLFWKWYIFLMFNRHTAIVDLFCLDMSHLFFCQTDKEVKVSYLAMLSSCNILLTIDVKLLCLTSSINYELIMISNVLYSWSISVFDSSKKQWNIYFILNYNLKQIFWRMYHIVLFGTVTINMSCVYLLND